MDKWKENRAYFIITSIITIFPMLIGILLWEQLPDRIATHFGINNIPNGWSSKGFAVFGLPIFCLVVHIFCMVSTLFDSKRKAISVQMVRMILFICPITSLFCGVCIYGYALSYPINIGVIAEVFVGLVFVIVGNYLPKCRQNHVVGIKVPWTLTDEENWNHTHRLAGWIWMPCGIFFIFHAFVPIGGSWIFFILFGIMIFVPIGYSYFYNLRHKT